MKAYTLAATAFRVIAVIMVLVGLFTVARSFWTRTYLAGVTDYSNSSVALFVASLAPGLVMYLAAPVLATIATWKIKE